ncbi:integral membrane protein [Aspergillus sclerotialis]|uniref:Integral membrane protein n=1 Tax=Aspergillus sclerotialis TaxID=2070753 RepID=A0A3A2ZPA9_9EURO|nr:integral membrane protein [Aspergillus sclerotialis]
MSIVMIAVVAPQAIANTLTAAFQCSPIRKAWASTIPGKCVNINAYYLANAALNIFTDILTYSLPMKVIFTLRVPRKQNIALGFILCLGLLACVSSIIRITYIPVMLSSPDATYVISEAMYWSVIETNVGIFAASAPSFTAIASRFLPRIIGEYSGRKISGRWHGSSFGRKQESGFSKVREPNTIRMGPYQRREAGTEVRVDHPTNSSIERIIVPEKIMTRTQITTSVDASHYFKDPYRSFDRI